MEAPMKQPFHDEHVVFDFDQDDCSDGVLNSFDEEKVKSQIERIVSSDTLQLVEEGYKGFNIIRWRDSFYALAQSLGPLDLPQVKEPVLREYLKRGRCFIGNSLEGVKRFVDQFRLQLLPKIIEEDIESRIPLLQRLTEWVPNDPYAHNILGEALYETGRIDEARTEFLRAQERLASIASEVHNNLAVLYWEYGNPIDVEKALKHADLAVRSDPQHSDAVINYSLMKEAIGEKKEAVQLLEDYLAVYKDEGVHQELKRIQQQSFPYRSSPSRGSSTEPGREKEERLFRIRCILVEAIDSLRDKEAAKNLGYLIKSFGIEDIRNLVISLPTLKHLDDLVKKLSRLQKERIERSLDPHQKTVVIFFPTGAYREHLGDIPERLKEKGYNVIIFIATICNDQYEKRDHVFYGGHDMVGQMDFVDVFICPSLTYGLPEKAKKVLFVHDIHDTPVGDEDEFLKIMLQFDYFFLPSDPVINLFKRILAHPTETRLKRRELCLIKGGYLKLDRLMAFYEKNKKDSKTIIYAPTIPVFNDLASLSQFSEPIIETIMKEFPDYELIFRPHPHTLRTSEVHRIEEKYKNHPGFIFDDNASFYMENYSKAALLITDLSGTAYTYALATLKPVIFFSPNEKEITSRFKDVKYFEDRHHIGMVAENIGEMVEKAKGLLIHRDPWRAGIEEYRNRLIYHLKNAEDYFIESFEYIIQGKKHQDWIYL